LFENGGRMKEKEGMQKQFTILSFLLFQFWFSNAQIFMIFLAGGKPQNKTNT